MTTPKQPLILLSGLLCDEYVWQPVADALVDVADTKIFSFAGFSDIPSMAAHVLSKAPKQFSLAGHSMGGRVALEIYHQAPNRVQRLALLNTGVHTVRDSEIPARLGLLELAKNEGMQAIADTWLPPMMSESALKSPTLSDALRSMVMRHTALDFEAQIHALLNRPDAEAVLPSITVPTVFISSTEDRWSPVQQHQDMQRQVAGSWLVTLDGVGHMSTVEAPDQMAAALKAWLCMQPEKCCE